MNVKIACDMNANRDDDLFTIEHKGVTGARVDDLPGNQIDTEPNTEADFEKNTDVITEVDINPNGKSSNRSMLSIAMDCMADQADKKTQNGRTYECVATTILPSSARRGGGDALYYSPEALCEVVCQGLGFGCMKASLSTEYNWHCKYKSAVIAFDAKKERISQAFMLFFIITCKESDCHPLKLVLYRYDKDVISIATLNRFGKYFNKNLGDGSVNIAEEMSNTIFTSVSKNEYYFNFFDDFGAFWSVQFPFEGHGAEFGQMLKELKVIAKINTEVAKTDVIIARKLTGDKVDLLSLMPSVERVVHSVLIGYKNISVNTAKWVALTGLEMSPSRSTNSTKSEDSNPDLAPIWDIPDILL